MAERESDPRDAERRSSDDLARETAPEDISPLDSADEAVEVVDLSEVDDVEVIDLDDDAPPAVRRAPPIEVIDLDDPEPTGSAGGPLRPGLPSDQERTRILAEVLRDQARREVLRDIAYRRPRASLRTRVLAASLALVALVLWLAPIPILRPEIPFPHPPQEEEAALRVAAFVQAQQIEAFRQSAGRLPDVLRETGEPLPGMAYERLNAFTYRLTGETERARVTWLSTDSLPELLGDSGTARLRTLVR